MPLGRTHRTVLVLLERIRKHVLQHVVRPAMEIDDVHVHPHAKLVRTVVERLEVRVLAVLRVDLIIVGYAVGVLGRMVTALLLLWTPARLVHVAVHLHERRKIHHIHSRRAHMVEHRRGRPEVSVACKVSQYDLIYGRTLQVFRRGAHSAK